LVIADDDDDVGIIITVAGTGEVPTSDDVGDGGPATEAQLSLPHGVVLDESGNLYIAEIVLPPPMLCPLPCITFDVSHRVRKVDADGIITTVVGTGEPPPPPGPDVDIGDGGPATEAQLNSPAGMVSDESGNLYITEFFGHRFRKVDAHGIITTVAGTGVDGFSGDGGPATSAQFNSPDLMTLDEDNLYITDFFNHRIRLVSIDDDDDCEGKGRKWNC
jgi:hypothetical protein